MTESVHTLIARIPASGVSNAAAALATTVANAADTGKLLVQVNGSAIAGGVIATGSTVKITAAKRENNGSISVVSTPEFNVSHIYEQEFVAAKAAVNLAMVVNFAPVSEAVGTDKYFIRLEPATGTSNHEAFRVSGATNAQLAARINKLAVLGVLTGVSAEANAEVLALEFEGDLGHQWYVSGHDQITVSVVARAADAIGDYDYVRALERSQNIQSGVTNQWLFPIVEPGTYVDSTATYAQYRMKLRWMEGDDQQRMVIVLLLADNRALAGPNYSVAMLNTVFGGPYDVEPPATPTLSLFDYGVFNESADNVIIRLGNYTAYSAADTLNYTITNSVLSEDIVGTQPVTLNFNQDLGIVEGNVFAEGSTGNITITISDEFGNVSQSATAAYTVNYSSIDFRNVYLYLNGSSAISTATEVSIGSTIRLSAIGVNMDLGSVSWQLNNQDTFTELDSGTATVGTNDSIITFYPDTLLSTLAVSVGDRLVFTVVSRDEQNATVDTIVKTIDVIA